MAFPFQNGVLVLWRLLRTLWVETQLSKQWHIMYKKRRDKMYTKNTGQRTICEDQQCILLFELWSMNNFRGHWNETYLAKRPACAGDNLQKNKIFFSYSKIWKIYRNVKKRFLAFCCFEVRGFNPIFIDLCVNISSTWKFLNQTTCIWIGLK